MNYQGQECLACRQIVTVYSLSGYCRLCFHKRRGEINKNNNYTKVDKNYNCPRCGRFQLTEDLCVDCLNKTPGYIEKYRSRSVGGIMQPEHRGVWEKAYGTLLIGWVVHHLNGLKGDNRLENLQAMPKNDHDSKAIINALKERIRELEIKIRLQ